MTAQCENSTTVASEAKAELVNSKVTASEIGALGGKNRSEKKLLASRKNLAKAQAVRNEKRVRSKARSAIA
jgi:hypothetical protein